MEEKPLYAKFRNKGLYTSTIMGSIATWLDNDGTHFPCDSYGKILNDLRYWSFF